MSKISASNPVAFVGRCGPMEVTLIGKSADGSCSGDDERISVKGPRCAICRALIELTGSDHYCGRLFVMSSVLPLDTAEGE